jgi:dihydrofolate reductase
MRPVVLQMTISLDGYVAGPNGEADITVGAEPPEVTAWKVAHLRDVDTHIMGRVTYLQMAAHWPHATDDYARFMNTVPKVVFTRTLEMATWPQTRIAREVDDEIAAMRAEPGGEIMAHGGASFVQELSRRRLIDEYRLVISPVAIGRGLSLFKDLPAPLRLTLIESNTYADGTAIHVYRR